MASYRRKLIQRSREVIGDMEEKEEKKEKKEEEEEEEEAREEAESIALSILSVAGVGKLVGMFRIREGRGLINAAYYK